MGDLELQIFADRLKELRTKLNITQKDFAEKIGVTAAALSAYENNVKNPSVSVAKRIAENFSVSIDWLCGLSDKMTNSSEICTYSDIIVLLNKLLEVPEIKCNLTTVTDPEYEGFINDNIPVIGAITFNDYKLTEIIQEWEKYRNINGGDLELNDNINKLWLEQARKKYNTSFESSTD